MTGYALTRAKKESRKKKKTFVNLFIFVAVTLVVKDFKLVSSCMRVVSSNAGRSHSVARPFIEGLGRGVEAEVAEPAPGIPGLVFHVTQALDWQFISVCAGHFYCALPPTLYGQCSAELGQAVSPLMRVSRVRVCHAEALSLYGTMRACLLLSHLPRVGYHVWKVLVISGLHMLPLSLVSCPA